MLLRTTHSFYLLNLAQHGMVTGHTLQPKLSSLRRHLDGQFRLSGWGFVHFFQLKFRRIYQEIGSTSWMGKHNNIKRNIDTKHWKYNGSSDRRVQTARFNLRHIILFTGTDLSQSVADVQQHLVSDRAGALTWEPENLNLYNHWLKKPNNHYTTTHLSLFLLYVTINGLIASISSEIPYKLFKIEVWSYTLYEQSCYFSYSTPQLCRVLFLHSCCLNVQFLLVWRVLIVLHFGRVGCDTLIFQSVQNR